MSRKFTVHPIDGSPSYQATYKEYIRSADWRQRADWFKAQSNHTCEECGLCPEHPVTGAAIVGFQVHVHHKHYRTLGNEHPKDVRVLCEFCHRLIHAEQRQQRR